MLAGFFILAICAWHLLRKNGDQVFSKSVKIAAPFTLILALLVAFAGHHQGQVVAQYQPAKLAAMESHWETQESAPMYLLVWPNQEEGRNSVEAIGHSRRPLLHGSRQFHAGSQGPQRLCA